MGTGLLASTVKLAGEPISTSTHQPHCPRIKVYNTPPRNSLIRLVGLLKGLRVRYRDEKENRIYHALFNDIVHFPDYGKYDPLTMGDEFYRSKDWAR